MICQRCRKEFKYRQGRYCGKCLPDDKTLFDASLSDHEMLRGMAKAANNRAEMLQIARKAARDIAALRIDRRITADDVQARLFDMGYTPEQLGNAAGSIFKGNEWSAINDFVPSLRVSSHRRMIRVWELIG
jgi:hypothetical protein